ncbi:hypothetical protein SNE35_30000 [Paucibacter sp. R3-3]|uniref:Serine kinase n=1 Tax=Roseateles agri TaxID=3098619 RepID=A0ABU5DTI3_9BURK|nr:hypothetical protein [Paucibacter sp. R3-3]MDY0748769.1 hypothetical protein [Paucibacter sp. R3-3]
MNPPAANAADPFGEFGSSQRAIELDLLGTRFEFRSDSAELLDLVDQAYADLPAQRLGATPAPLRVDLALIDDISLADQAEPPLPRMHGGAGLFGAVIDGANFAFAAPAARGACVSISRGLLAAHRYHARYELLEFAVFTLASRAQNLAPLHAGCVGWQGRGVLLIGDSGAGKTTLTLQALLEGMEFLTEDASFVDPASLKVTGVANFLHPRFDALRFVKAEARRVQMQAAPVIRRRSGVEKFEVDLRGSGAVLAATPLALQAIVFLSPEVSDGQPLLRPLDLATATVRLRATQPYAAQLDNWPAFERSIAKLRCFELRRGAHPREGVAALGELLGRH